jgi:hypothetical protein
MSFIKQISGQSNYDLSIEGYGDLDRIVKLCKDNNVSRIDNPILSQKYYVDESLIFNTDNIGYPYSTFYSNALDPDVSAFLIALQADNAYLYQWQINAVERLVLDLKGYPNPLYPTKNIWNKFVYIYPFVGGTAASHRFNLKNPATFKITYTGNPSHSLSGCGWPVPGTDGVNTNLAPSVSLSLNNTHIGYRPMFVDTAPGSARFVITCFSSSTSVITLDVASRNVDFYSNASRIAVPNNDTNKLSLYVLDRNSSTNYNVYRDGISVVTGGSPAGTLPSASLQYGGSPSFPANAGIKFGSAGFSLTSSEHVFLKAAEANYQKMLGR